MACSRDYTSGVTNFDAYIATNPLHTSTFAGFEWFGNAGTTTATVTYDLGSVRSFDRLALWNEESSGIGLLDLWTSIDGTTFTSLASGLTPFDNPWPITRPMCSPWARRHATFVLTCRVARSPIPVRSRPARSAKSPSAVPTSPSPPCWVSWASASSDWWAAVAAKPRNL
jgi:hypothetical protein